MGALGCWGAWGCTECAWWRCLGVGGSHGWARAAPLELHVAAMGAAGGRLLFRWGDALHRQRTCALPAYTHALLRACR